MRQTLAMLAGLFLSAAGCSQSATAQAPVPQAQVPGSAGTVTYEQIAEGVQRADLFRTDSLRDVIVDVKDVIVGPGKSAPETTAPGFTVTELKSGEIETTIDGQTTRRRPGDFWAVGPGQRYAIRNSSGMAVLHTVIFAKP
jgi:quercetin dioxygenase-like cupin family protein